MTLPLFRRPARQPRPVLVSLSNHFRFFDDGVTRRQVTLRLADGSLVERFVREERLAGLVVAA